MTHVLDSRHVYLVVLFEMASSELIGDNMAIQNQLRSDPTSPRMCQGTPPSRRAVTNVSARYLSVLFEGLCVCPFADDFRFGTIPHCIFIML